MPHPTHIAALVLLLLIGTVLPAATQPSQRQKPAEEAATAMPMVHDPVMAECGGRYYIFCTGQGISVFVSDDMREWHYDGAVFDTPPEWVTRYVPRFNGHIWAPDIIYHDGMYHIFYSCSTFGSNRSVIGHAVNATLDRSDPAYRWVDTGAVISSSPTRDDWNAIDPNVVIDDAGEAWMAFGSFWSGIRIVRLDEDLSRTYSPTVTRLIAARDRAQSRENAIEAPFIFRHDGYYYLFVSIDACCRGAKSTYKMAVGRSRRIDGPYLDRDGRPMTEGGMTRLASSSDKWAAIGHCCIHTIGSRDFLAAHAYDARNGRSTLFIRPIEWDADGWPAIEP